MKRHQRAAVALTAAGVLGYGGVVGVKAVWNAFRNAVEENRLAEHANIEDITNDVGFATYAEFHADENKDGVISRNEYNGFYRWFSETNGIYCGNNGHLYRGTRLPFCVGELEEAMRNIPRDWQDKPPKSLLGQLFD